MPKSDLDYSIGANPQKALEAMAKTQIKMEGQIAKLKEANREAKKAGQAGKQAGEDTAAGADKAKDSSDKMGASMLKGIQSWVGGLMGVGGVVAAYKAVQAEMVATDEAMRQMAERAEGYQKAALALANQYGIGATAAGQKIGGEELAQIMRAGRFGDDLARGQALGISAHAAFGTRGQPLSGGSLEIQKLVAQYAGYKDLSAEATGGLMKVLAQAGVTTATGAAQRIGQFSTGYEGALSTDPSQSVLGLSKFLGGMMAEGGEYEQTLALYNRAVQVSGSEAEAATRARTMGNVMKSPRMVQAMAKERLGMTGQDIMTLAEIEANPRAASKQAKEMGISFDELRQRAKGLAAMEENIYGASFPERMREMGGFVNKYAQNERVLLGAGMEARQMSWGVGIFGGGGYQDWQNRAAALRGVTAGKTIGELTAFGQTPYARRLETVTETTLGAGQVSDATLYGQTLWKQAETTRALQREGAEADPLLWGAAIMPERAELEYTAQSGLRKRLQRLKGRVSDADWIKASRSLYQLNPTMDLSWAGQPSFNIRELGEAGLQVQALEDKASIAAIQANTAAVNELNNTIKNSVQNPVLEAPE